jgi:hypothetical protein
LLDESELEGSRAVAFMIQRCVGDVEKVL